MRLVCLCYYIIRSVIMLRLLTAPVCLYIFHCALCESWRCSRVSAPATLLEPISLWKVLITLTLERDLTRFARACFYDYCCLSVPAKPVSRYVLPRLYLCQALSVCLSDSRCRREMARGYRVQGRGLSSTASAFASHYLSASIATWPFPFPLPFPLHSCRAFSFAHTSCISFIFFLNCFIIFCLLIPRCPPYPTSPLAELQQLVLTAGTTDDCGL